MEPETILQNRIIAELNARGHYARNHTVGQFFTRDGRIVHIGVHGEADIDGFRKGDARALFLECKVPGKKPREDQMQFLRAMARMGAIAGWFTSIDEAIKIVEDGYDVKLTP